MPQTDSERQGKVIQDIETGDPPCTKVQAGGVRIIFGKLSEYRVQEVISLNELTNVKRFVTVELWK